MDKKRLTAVIFLLLGVTVFSQPRYDYQPMNSSQQQDISNVIFTNNVSSFFVNDRIPIGKISLTNFMNMISYNPIEGTRLRVSLETNESLSKKFALSSMIAYGTSDNRLKYAFSVAYNFAGKPKGVYAFPCSTLSLSFENNTYMPSYPNYDISYFSFGSWDRFYFARKKQATVSFLQEFKNSSSLRPFVYWQRIDSYMLYENGNINELLNKEYAYNNYAFGLEVSYTPTRKTLDLMNIFNSRFYSFPTQVTVRYSYNIQRYITENNYNKAEISAQRRFILSPLALDLQISGGAIFGQSDRYMYFTPNYRISDVSNMFGFNLYSPWEVRTKQYIQTFTQLNLGGIILDNVPYVKNFRPNEFINLKMLFTENNDPYIEAGVGIDHIFSFLGLEFIKRFSKENPYNMPEYGIKIRCTL